MPLVLTERERETLAGNRLKVVVAQVKFPAILSLTTSAGVAPFQEAIRDRYPIAADRGQHLTVRVSQEGLEANSAQPGPWRFLTEDGLWTVALGTDALSLETTSYTEYPDFVERAAELFRALLDVVRPARVDRFGFRFVNEIALPGVRTLADWRPYLGEDLLALTGSGELSERVTFALQQINLELDEGKINFKHGYAPGAGDPNVPSVYVIDIDTFDDEPKPFDVAGIVEKMNLYNQWAWNLFRSNVRDPLLDSMGDAGANR